MQARRGSTGVGTGISRFAFCLTTHRGGLFMMKGLRNLLVGRRRAATALIRLSALCAAAAIIGLAALCASAAHAQTCLSSSQTGNNNGFYYSFWTDGGGSVQFCLQGGGRYTSNWSNVGNWVGGKGWATGSNHTVNYSG